MSDANTARQGVSGGFNAGASSGYVTNVTGLYLTMGLGTILTLWLFVTFAGSMGVGSLGSGLGTGANTLQGVASVAFALVIVAGPILTTIVAYWVGRDEGHGAGGAIAGAIANVVGVVVTVVVLFLLVVVLSESAAGLDQAVGPVALGLLGMAIGVAITGAAGGAIGGRSAQS